MTGKNQQLLQELEKEGVKYLPWIGKKYEEGIYYTVAKSRGRKKSLETTLKLTTEFLKDAKSYRLAVAHGDAYEEGQWLKAELAKRLPHATEILFGDISPALVVHTGPGLLGLGIQILDN